MTAMPHLAALDWDHADRLQHCDLGGGGDVWFVYDAQGNRVRKVQVNQSGSTTRERIYLGDWEVWRERTATGMQRERETLHIADDTGRICLIETLTVEDGDAVDSPTPIQRYQHGNHLGSVALELDEDAAIISYEEFHPFGMTSYAANDSTIEVSPKRYRYIGKERDEETGLYHCRARYYASWLGRWTACDPVGLDDGVNRYAYVQGNPLRLVDGGGTASHPTALEVERAVLVAQRTAIDAKLLAISGRDRQLAQEASTLNDRIANLQGQTKELRGSLRLAHSYAQSRSAIDSSREPAVSAADIREFAEEVRGGG